MAVVGTNVPRKDALPKVSGEARYIDDLTFPGMLHGQTIRSTIARGRVRSIRHDYDTAGFTIVDHSDIPGDNIVDLIEDDQPCLVEREVRHVAEPILLIAHEDREALLRTRVEIEYEVLEPVLDPELATEFLSDLTIEHGDAEAGLASADLIVEGVYQTGHQEQLYIETNGVIAVPEDGGMTVYGSMQCPYYVHRALARLLALPPEKVRVVQVETGGGFGGKEEYPSILSCHAALLALKSNRPVKIIYDRVEDMLATTKRHPFRVRHRTGVMRDGRIVASDIDILADGGAYVTLSPVVVSRGSIHATGPYAIPNVRIRGRGVKTNTPPNGAFRGFGAPQTQFAAEVHMDEIAAQLGLDPIALRELNALRPGDRNATGSVMGADCSAIEVLQAALEKTDFHTRRVEYAAFNAAQSGRRRGIGLSLYYHGSGFTGAGEVHLASEAALELTERAVCVRAASAEIGQGTRTIFAQIVAETLGIGYDEVECALPDTRDVPDSGPTVASRTCMVVGGLLHRCALEMKERLNGLSPRDYFAQQGGFTVLKSYEPPPGLYWDEQNYRGDAYGTYAWGCHVAEVEVDLDTCEVKPLHITAVQEIGKAIHPVLLAGQVEGGTAQGIGYALLENVIMKDGAMANASLTNYLIPTTLDTPPMDVIILERAYPHGPFGAKGVGELPIDGPAPALVNALRSAGLHVTSLPVTPETLMTAV